MADTLTDEDISELFLQTGKNGLRRCAKFSGVYMSDELSKLIPEQGKVYIVNLGASNRHNKDGSVGTHWVAISNMLLSSIIYFQLPKCTRSNSTAGVKTPVLPTCQVTNM